MHSVCNMYNNKTGKLIVFMIFTAQSTVKALWVKENSSDH